MATLVWSWQAPDLPRPPDSYNLYVGPAPGGETLLQAGIAALTWTQTAATVGLYYGRVRAVYDGVESADSDEAVAAVRPPAPTNMTASAGWR